MREDCSVLLIYVFVYACIVIRYSSTSLFTIYSACICFIVSPVTVTAIVCISRARYYFPSPRFSTVAGACMSGLIYASI